jgi:hypothetical protein
MDVADDVYRYPLRHLALSGGPSIAAGREKQD